jgi:hypothetical protein
VIALTNGPETYRPLRRFSFNLAAGLTLLMALFIFSPAADFYLFVVQDMTALVGALAESSLALFLFFPALATITSWLRGLLINRRVTREVNVGMALNLVTTGLILAIGLANRWPGLPAAAIALNAASLVEILYLGWRTQRILPEAVPLPGLGKASLIRKRRLEIGD